MTKKEEEKEIKDDARLCDADEINLMLLEKVMCKYAEKGNVEKKESNTMLSKRILLNSEEKDHYNSITEYF